ncbi:MAG: hypothetical protein NT068_03605 [Candidatus Nomurabacteria bacterium]|nr:hypothetical protein [Candidatus Nomurabacteria bacterium]
MIQLTSFVFAVIHFTVVPLFTENYFALSRVKTEVATTPFILEVEQDILLVFFTKNNETFFKVKNSIVDNSRSERKLFNQFSYEHSMMLLFYPTGFT